jgi:hypothetical protein
MITGIFCGKLFRVQCVKPCNRKASGKARKNTVLSPLSTVNPQDGMIALRQAHGKIVYYESGQKTCSRRFARARMQRCFFFGITCRK